MYVFSARMESGVYSQSKYPLCMVSPGVGIVKGRVQDAQRPGGYSTRPFKGEISRSLEDKEYGCFLCPAERSSAGDVFYLRPAPL